MFVCTNRRSDDDERGSCAARGANAIYQQLKEQVKARGLSGLGARVCSSSCLDQCSSGVTILVEPDHFFYGHVTADDVDEIVEALATGKRLERRVLVAEGLAKP
ncbi:MAG: (2Fe-2S) ferredoxin domain-containing protein [Verrucomicrobiota bacterium]|nr:(2Fe-2S) ferredoxin domain-containing protein [Verrucomicrobiota bacterium]